MYDTCKDHMHAYVLVQTHDGTQFDGIITGLDEEYAYFAVPTDGEQHESRYQNEDYDRQFFGPGFGPGFGYGPGFGPWYGPRRFRRLILPLAGLAAISLLPWY